MALENLTGNNVFITNLVPSNPQPTDPVSEGDNHIAGTKNVLINSFPNINGAVTATPADLNKTATLDDVYAKLDSPAFIGTPTAPTAAPGTSTTQLATTEFSMGSGVGSNQTWQNLTGSRVSGTTYTNSTGKPIMVNVSCQAHSGTAGYTVQWYINDVVMGFLSTAGTPGIDIRVPCVFIVPNGATYRVDGGAVTTQWAELR
jgi:hypothetical protein